MTRTLILGMLFTGILGCGRGRPDGFEVLYLGTTESLVQSPVEFRLQLGADGTLGSADGPTAADDVIRADLETLDRSLGSRDRLVIDLDVEPSVETALSIEALSLAVARVRRLVERTVPDRVSRTTVQVHTDAVMTAGSSPAPS